MSEIPDDIRRKAEEWLTRPIDYLQHNTLLYFVAPYGGVSAYVISRAVEEERTRCLTIIQSIETTSAQGMRVIDEIARKVRGGE
jgi:hypothetical protein